jgi:hypothetical protein
MGRSPAVVTLILSAFFTFGLMLIFMYIWNDTITVPMTDIANSTLTGTYLTSYTGLLAGLPAILGTAGVILLGAALIAYVLDSHRYEGEEYERRY